MAEPDAAGDQIQQALGAISARLDTIEHRLLILEGTTRPDALEQALAAAIKRGDRIIRTRRIGDGG